MLQSLFIRFQVDDHCNKMGTLLGHVLPGSFFILFSLWWIVSISQRYFRSKFDPHFGKYKNTATFPSRRWSNIPVEAYFKLLAAVAGTIGEIITGFKWVDGSWQFANLIPNGHHIMMFSFFGFNAVADLVIFYKVLYLPKDTDYVSASIAVAVEGQLFANHLHGRDPLDVKLHSCLVVLIILCAISSLAEMVGNRDDVRYGLIRSCCYLWQGTWFLQVGIILYPHDIFPIWDHQSMETRMIIDLIFLGHFWFSILVVFLIGIFVHHLVKSNHHKLNTQSNGSYECHKLIYSQDMDVDATCVENA